MCFFGKPEGRDNLGDLEVDESILKIYLQKLARKGVERIHLAQNRHKWQAYVNTNNLVPILP
jgi:hypothetical protein